MSVEEKNISLRNWIQEYSEGRYNPEMDNKDDIFEKMCAAGWYDWFCSNSALVNRLKKFNSIAKKITNDYILDNFYVWFKNNCPVDGPLYDDMRFEPFDENKREKKYFLIAIDCCHYEKKYAVVTAKNGYEVEFQTDKKQELIDYINSLDLEKDNHLSINDWIKKVGPIDKFSKKTFINILDIVEKHLFERLINKYPSFEENFSTKLFKRCYYIYQLMNAITNEKLKENYFVELSEFNDTDNSFFFDACSFKRCDTEELQFKLCFDFPFKEWKETLIMSTSEQDMEEFKNNLPNGIFKYSLFSVKNRMLCFLYATNDLKEMIEKLNTL